jgi:hypothetical protein
VEHFDAQGTTVEKYDVRRRSSDLVQGLRFGYSSNEIGFGWTKCRRSGAHGGTRSLRTVEGAGRSGPVKGRGR